MAAHVIDIGPRVPRWGNAVNAAIANAVLRALGWHLEVHLPDLPKIVVIGVPHTSNWDFVIGVAAIILMRVRVRWWVKHTAYRWPFRGLADWAGAIPINRSAAHGVVDQTVEAFESEPTLVLGLPPEGTRGHVGQWKRGFYHVAMRAKVPIALAYFDYRRKIVGIGLTIWPSGDYAADTAKMLEFYRDHAAARRPELWSGRA